MWRQEDDGSDPCSEGQQDIVVRRGGDRETLNMPVLGRLRQGSLRPGVTDHWEQHSKVTTLIKKKSQTQVNIFLLFYCFETGIASNL